MNISTAATSPTVGDASQLDDEARDLIARLNAQESEHIAGLPTDDPNDPKRQRRVGLTLPEILDQPDCVVKTVRGHRGAIRSTAEAIAHMQPTQIIMTGCGDSLAVR